MAGALRWGEMPGSGNISDRPPSLEKRMWINGTVNEFLAVQVAKNFLPLTTNSPFGKLYRQNIRVDWQASDHAIATVTYNQFEDINVTYSTGGGTVHITNSLETKNRYARPGDAAPDMKGAIGLEQDQVIGTDVFIPAGKFTVNFKNPPGVVDMRFVRQVLAKTAYINSDKWFDYEPGEVLFLGANGVWGRETETITAYDFAVSENADGVSSPKLNFGEIANVVKRGHDYCWLRYMEDVSDFKYTKRPQYAYVERLYKEMEFSKFFTFGQMPQS